MKFINYLDICEYVSQKTSILKQKMRSTNLKIIPKLIFLSVTVTAHHYELGRRGL